MDREGSDRKIYRPSPLSASHRSAAGRFLSITLYVYIYIYDPSRRDENKRVAVRFDHARFMIFNEDISPSPTSGYTDCYVREMVRQERKERILLSHAERSPFS